MRRLLSRFASTLSEDRLLLSSVAVCQRYVHQGRTHEVPKEVRAPATLSALGMIAGEEPPDWEAPAITLSSPACT